MPFGSSARDGRAGNVAPTSRRLATSPAAATMECRVTLAGPSRRLRPSCHADGSSAPHFADGSSAPHFADGSSAPHFADGSSAPHCPASAALFRIAYSANIRKAVPFARIAKKSGCRLSSGPRSGFATAGRASAFRPRLRWAELWNLEVRTRNDRADLPIRNRQFRMPASSRRQLQAIAGSGAERPLPEGGIIPPLLGSGSAGLGNVAAAVRVLSSKFQVEPRAAASRIQRAYLDSHRACGG